MLPIQSLSLTALVVASMASVTLAAPRPTTQPTQSPSHQQTFKKRSQGTSSPFSGPSTLVAPCGKDEVLSTWNKPIYDNQGLFVVGYKKVPICIHKDLEPAVWLIAVLIILFTVHEFHSSPASAHSTIWAFALESGRSIPIK
jgi:hypothetical protein